MDRGIYPDPEYGLNNLAIPESLNKQDYWYRTEIKSPEAFHGDHLTLTFEGINYKAVVWLNGHNLGTIKGAFIRGNFDVTGIWKTGKGDVNVLAVEVSPPPHPGIPQEQSIKGGPGENGGIMCLDGPTFVASEGWDWIPGIRDRETGIWQAVELRATAAVKIGDAQVVTTLPLPDTSRADVAITVPLENFSDAPVRGTLKAAFESDGVGERSDAAAGGDNGEAYSRGIQAAYGAAAAPVVAERLRKAGPVSPEIDFRAGRKFVGHSGGAFWNSRDYLRVELAGSDRTFAARGD